MFIRARRNCFEAFPPSRLDGRIDADLDLDLNLHLMSARFLPQVSYDDFEEQDGEAFMTRGASAGFELASSRQLERLGHPQAVPSWQVTHGSSQFGRR